MFSLVQFYSSVVEGFFASGEAEQMYQSGRGDPHSTEWKEVTVN